MKCRKCGRRLSERISKPITSKETITLYHCTNALCEYDEDADPRRQRWQRRS